MKYRLFIIMLFLTTSLLIAKDLNRPEEFEFGKPNTMVGKLALSYYGQKKYFSSDNFKIVPTSFEIYQSKDNQKIYISFASVADGGASWYSRELIYNAEKKEYEFTVYNFGGAWQRIKIKFAEDKILCYVKEGDIWGEDDDWSFVSDIIYLLNNYEP